ncbi:MAG: transketolase [Candidatus Liptonbacteria bacterium]|nr:transketolase [Candidatus Liptonbacteria bacterium]
MEKINKGELLYLKRKANWLRRTVLEMAVKGKSGHVTTAFSLAELFVALYHGKILNFDSENPQWENRDRFILSEGQAGLGLYPVLADVGFFPLKDLDNFLGEESTLGVHSEPHTKGIDVLTGSLGHGLPIATGMADSAKLDGKSWLTICLTGDGELYEGSNWEAMLTARRLGLNNLVLIVNRNHQFTIGFTDSCETQRDVYMDPLPEKFQAFGFETRTANGHSFPEIFKALSSIRGRNSSKPLAVLMETIKGKGASAIEGKRGWHYKVPTGEILEAVMAGLREEEQKLEAQALKGGAL